MFQGEMSTKTIIHRYHIESHSIEESCYECEEGLALMGGHPPPNGMLIYLELAVIVFL